MKNILFVTLIIIEDEKEVITYRLVDILNKMYFYPIILIINK